MPDRGELTRYPPTVNPERPWELTVIECAVFGKAAESFDDDAPIGHPRELAVYATRDSEGAGHRLLAVDIADQRFLVREDALLIAIQHAPEEEADG